MYHIELIKLMLCALGRPVSHVMCLMCLCDVWLCAMCDDVERSIGDCHFLSAIHLEHT